MTVGRAPPWRASAHRGAFAARQRLFRLRASSTPQQPRARCSSAGSARTQLRRGQRGRRGPTLWASDNESLLAQAHDCLADGGTPNAQALAKRRGRESLPGGKAKLHDAALQRAVGKLGLLVLVGAVGHPSLLGHGCDDWHITQKLECKLSQISDIRLVCAFADNWHPLAKTPRKPLTSHL